ncbi:MAG: recombinase family protein [Rhizobiaceae bacterium]|jgi:DNA invertase Pin-like site-specific DNA recombinase|nr:MAG: recombinase family protein [Rhizobiaceae bacterium]
MADDLRLIGYARVSTDEQSLDLQTEALRSAGCHMIFTDQISGATRSRQGLDNALRQLRAGDKIVVWRLDRLGRSLLHLVEILNMFNEKQVKFCSLCEHIDTGSSGGRLVFHIMAALAEFERGLISERTRAGMAVARSHGKQMGRRPSMSQEQCDAALLLCWQGHSLVSIARRFNTSEATLRRSLKKLEAYKKSGVATLRELRLVPQAVCIALALVSMERLAPSLWC